MVYYYIILYIYNYSIHGVYVGLSINKHKVWGPHIVHPFPSAFHHGPPAHLSRLALLRQAGRSIGGSQVAARTLGHTARARMQIYHLGERGSQVEMVNSCEFSNKRGKMQPTETCRFGLNYNGD